MQAYETISKSVEAGRSVPSYIWKAAEGTLLVELQQQSLPHRTKERLLNAHKYAQLLSSLSLQITCPHERQDAIKPRCL